LFIFFALVMIPFYSRFMSAPGTIHGYGSEPGSGDFYHRLAHLRICLEQASMANH